MTPSNRPDWRVAPAIRGATYGDAVCTEKPSGLAGGRSSITCELYLHAHITNGRGGTPTSFLVATGQ